MLKGVDSDSASELEFNSEAEEDGEGVAVTTNEVRYLSLTKYCIVHDYSVFPKTNSRHNGRLQLGCGL